MGITQRFRRIWPFLTPGWRHEGDGGPELFTYGLVLDNFVQRIRSGLEARMPSRAMPSANVLTSGDRGILRGRSESDDDFIARLLAWRTPRTHLVRGNAYEAIKQIWHYWGGIFAATVDAHGLRHTIDEDGTLGRDYVDWEGRWDATFADEDHWARFWITLQPPASMGVAAQPALGDPDLWGGALGLPGYTLGQQGVTPADVLAMRTLFQDLNWHPGHTVPEWVIVGLEPDAPPPKPHPVSSDWGQWSRNDGGTQVATRVPAPLTFSHGSAVFQNGAGTINIDLPDDYGEGALFLLWEARSAVTFDAEPAGWTTIATSIGPFQRGRLYARLALSPVDEPSAFNYAVTGADDHAFRVTAVSPPGEGWQADVAANFADIVTSTSTTPVVNPDNEDEQHRLNFLLTDYFDNIQASATTGYTELYDSGNEINLSLSHGTGEITGSTTTFANGDACLASVRLVYHMSYRFWALDPRVNAYAGDPTNYPEAATDVEGTGVYAGDPAEFDSASTLPNGNSADGDPAIFTSSVQLLDDGSSPS